jgi:hypothetical protein
MLRKFARPEREEEKFEDFQADDGSPHYGTFIHGGLSGRFPELSVLSGACGSVVVKALRY